LIGDMVLVNTDPRRGANGPVSHPKTGPFDAEGRTGCTAPGVEGWSETLALGA
jgi:hypothetical protein